ncbi:CLUMA_CG020859, isoform A, partial [Clunio marinus]
MSLLSVAVKRAKFIGDQAAHLNTYVILKLQNVKTSTAPIKGAEPEWNQDFLFETSSVNTALLVEVWSKNILLDRAIGYQLIPLGTLPYVQYEYPTENEQWYNIDAEQIIINNEVQGTKEPTGHLILLDLHFELPFDVDTQNNDQLTNKINYNNIDYNTEQYIENYKSYGDYTSTDYNCTNASLHGTQYDQLETPYSSLENSRQNSYERDERQ